VSHAEDDDFVVSDFVKNQVRIWAGNKTTHALVARPVSSVWMFKCQMDKPLNASLHFLRASRRCSRAHAQDQTEHGACSEVSKAVLGPEGPHLIVRRELTTIGLRK
jgi:hypothetical protein